MFRFHFQNKKNAREIKGFNTDRGVPLHKEKSNKRTKTKLETRRESVTFENWPLGTIGS